MPDVNVAELEKALHYIKNENKQLLNHRRAKSSINDENINLPQVYRRLWDNVAMKSKKAQELTKVITDQRKLNWLKQLFIVKLLNPPGFKDKEILKQLQIYDEKIQQTNQYPSKHNPTLADMQIRGHTPAQARSNSILEKNMNSSEMDKIIELFDEE